MKPTLKTLLADRPCLICKTWPAQPYYLTMPQCGGKDIGNNFIVLCGSHRREMVKSLRKFIERNKVFETWLKDHDRIDVIHQAFRFYNS